MKEIGRSYQQKFACSDDPGKTKFEQSSFAETIDFVSLPYGWVFLRKQNEVDLMNMVINFRLHGFQVYKNLSQNDITNISTVASSKLKLRFILSLVGSWQGLLLMVKIRSKLLIKYSLQKVKGVRVGKRG